MMHPKHWLISTKCRTRLILKTNSIRVLGTITTQISSQNLVHSSMWSFEAFHVFLEALEVASVVCDQTVDFGGGEGTVGVDVRVWEE